MTNAIDAETDSVRDPAHEPFSPWPARVGWGLFIVAYLAFAIVTIATIQSGLHGDPTRTNPNPRPAPYPPFLGFDNWPLAVSISSIPMAVGLIAALVWLSWRQRRVHCTVIIAFAGLITGALDPLANWATFAIFDPRMLHFPLLWPYVNISPNLEPALAFLGGYAAYYLLNGLGFLQIHQRLLEPLMRRASWLAPHRLVRVFIGATIIAIPINGVIQYTWMRAGIFFYTEAVGPILQVGHIHIPLIMAVYDAMIFGMVAVMCVRNEDGELVLINRIARWLPSRRGRPRITLTRQLIISVAIGLVSFALPLAVLAGLREAGFSRPAFDRNPFPTVNLYDPYGHLEEANKRERRYRVVHVGTGLTGREALRAVIDDPALELVGVKVSTPDKVGVDAGRLCGTADVGIGATGDVATVLALEPDCVMYCATAVRREEDAIADIVGYLEAGVNVVTFSTIPMVYPPAAPAEWQASVHAAAMKGGSTFYATGSEPGFISLNIPTALLTGAGRVDAYRMDEYAVDLDKSYPIWDVLHESMGFGKPDGHVPARIAYGKVNADWESVVRYIADILGLELDGVELDWETLLAPTDLQTAIGVIPKGTICAHRWQLAGMVGTRAAVAVQYFATVSTTPWPDRWPKPTREGQGGMVFRVEGNPSMNMELYLEQSPTDRVNPGVAVTALAAVNAIPAVIEAPAGVLAYPLAGPAIVSRQSRM